MSDRIPESPAAPPPTDLCECGHPLGEHYQGDPHEIGACYAENSLGEYCKCENFAAAPQEPLASAPRDEISIREMVYAIEHVTKKHPDKRLFAIPSKLSELEAGLREARSMFEATEELRAKETAEIARLTERNALLANALTDAQSALRSKDIQITALRSEIAGRDAVIEAARTVRRGTGWKPFVEAIDALTPSAPE